MLSIIVATGNNNIIGGNNSLLWHLPPDLKRFKEITSNKVIIMGRKTFESLPFVLPNRTHIVITKNPDFKIDHPQVEISNNLEKVLTHYQNTETEAFIIGGGSIYKESLPYIQKLYLTKIFKDFEGDTYFPQIDLDVFKTDYSSEDFYDENSDLTYKYINFIRN